MENMSIYVALFFGLVTIITLLLFRWTIKRSSSEIIRNKADFIFIILLFWLIIQAVLSLNNIYNSKLNSFPPKILLFGILPAFFVIFLIFNIPKGKIFVDNLPLLNLTYINIIRVFVEITLYFLFLNKMIPKLMTFEGINFDIIAGITSPFIAYYGIHKSLIKKSVILWWNIISLTLLANIVIIAFLSTPFPLQRIGFEQPNIAVLYFPFCWLPTFIVPVIVFGHLVSIKQLLKLK